MGMAAHQSRFLALTSRQNSIGLQLTRLAAEKTSLARDMQKVSRKYNESLSTKMLTWSNNSGINYSVLSYKTLMTPNSLNGNTPYFISDKDGRIVIDSQYEKYAKMISPDGSPVSMDWKNSPVRSQIIGEITGSNTPAMDWIEHNFQTLQPSTTKAGGYTMQKAQHPTEEQLAEDPQTPDIIETEKTNFNNWLITRAKETYCQVNKIKGGYDDNKYGDAYKQYMPTTPTMLDYYEYKAQQADGYANMLEYFEGVADYYSSVNFLTNPMVKELATQIGDYGFGQRQNNGSLGINGYAQEGGGNPNSPDNGAIILYNYLEDLVQGNTTGSEAWADEIISYYIQGVDAKVTDPKLQSVLKEMLVEIQNKPNSANALKELFNNEYHNNNANGGGAWRTILYSLIEKAFQKISADATLQLSAGTSSTATMYDKYQAALDNKNNVFNSEELAKINFYDKLFASIAENGWVENDKIKDNDYLNNMLQNNQYMITTQSLVEGEQWQNCYYSLGVDNHLWNGNLNDIKATIDAKARAGFEDWGTKDHYKYETDLAINFDKIYSVSNSDLQAEALTEYESQKAIIKSKEARIDTRMRNLETEQAAISERKKALESMLKENTERLNIFNA